MYCSNCGNEAQGNFCSRCGAPLDSAAVGVPRLTADSTDFAAIARLPEVRELVARHAALAKKNTSAAEFMKLFDSLRLLGGVPIAPIASVASEFYARLGMKTGKARRERVQRPAAEVFVATLCSLARNGQVVKEIRPATDGCAIEAVLPSDVFAWEGVLAVVLERREGATEVDARTTIKGQLFDWGKSSRALDVLVEDMRTLPVS